jgi:hypothetical protein
VPHESVDGVGTSPQSQVPAPSSLAPRGDRLLALREISPTSSHRPVRRRPPRRENGGASSATQTDWRLERS